MNAANRPSECGNGTFSTGVRTTPWPRNTAGGTVTGLVGGDHQGIIEAGRQVGRGGMCQVVLDVADRWTVAKRIPQVRFEARAEVGPGGAGKRDVVNVGHRDASLAQAERDGVIGHE